jgi:hypothetical protein
LVLALVWRARRVPTESGSLLPLRVLSSVVAWLALALWAAADASLAQHPETTQNPDWFRHVPVAARLATYAIFCWGIHRLVFKLGDLATRPRCSECGCPIVEDVRDWWNGEPVHHACGLQAWEREWTVYAPHREPAAA